MTSIDDYFNRQEEKRQKERTLPINEMDDIIPIYDTDGLPFEKDGAFSDVEGMTAPPSEATIRKGGYFLSEEGPSYEETGEGAHEIGFYPLDGRRPFIGWSDREPNGELPYSNKDEFAFAVATKLLLDYELASKVNYTEDEVLDKLILDLEKKRYRLPDRFLAMDVLLCAQYCPEEFKQYVSVSKNLAGYFIELSKIKYFRVCKGKIEHLEKRKNDIMFF